MGPRHGQATYVVVAGVVECDRLSFLGERENGRRAVSGWGGFAVSLAYFKRYGLLSAGTCVESIDYWDKPRISWYSPRKEL